MDGTYPPAVAADRRRRSLTSVQVFVFTHRHASWDRSNVTAQRSFDELGTPLRDVTFCVLDLETTGGNRNDDMITEIGVVKVRGGECLGTFQTLVNPGRAIPPQITILTGLTDAVVAPAPRIESGPALAPRASSATRSSSATTSAFDLGVPPRSAARERTGRAPLTNSCVDTVALARRLVRDEVPDCRLGTLASRFRLDHQPSHRALDDALGHHRPAAPADRAGARARRARPRRPVRPRQDRPDTRRPPSSR